MITSLSSLQYSMLKTFTDHNNSFHMSISEAQEYDQRPFASMLKRGYVIYRPGRGFHLTVAGIKAMEDFMSRRCNERKNRFGPLCRYFDPIAYGLDESIYKRKLKLAKTA